MSANPYSFEPIDAYRELAEAIAAESEEQAKRLIPRQLFHYTNTASVASIVESGQMWATDARFLNDPSELKYGVGLLGSVLEGMKAKVTAAYAKALILLMQQFADIENLGFSYYVICFCEDGDLLSQWRGYGGAAGYSIGIASDFNVGFNNQIQVEAITQGVSRLRVEYDPERTMDHMRATILRFLDLLGRRWGSATSRQEEVQQAAAFASGPLVIEALRAKAPAFKAEQEWRLIAIADEPDILPDVNMRATPSRLVPYIELKLTASAAEAPTPPIATVIMGPTVKEPTAEVSLRLLLDKKGHKDAIIEPSKIPLIV